MEFGPGESPVSLDERDPFVVTDEAEAWAEKYLAADGNSLGPDSDLIRDVEYDGVNHERVEVEVRRLLSTIEVEEGFCARCRHLLCHWPDLSTTQGSFSRGFGSVSEIEAAAGAGCTFCAFIFSKLGYFKELHTFRKIEQRLAVIRHDVSMVLSISGFGPRPGPVGPAGTHLISLTLPGKRPYPPRYGGGILFNLVSSVEDPSGKVFSTCVPKILVGMSTDRSIKRACGKENSMYWRLPEYGSTNALNPTNLAAIRMNTKDQQGFFRLIAMSPNWCLQKPSALCPNTLRLVTAGVISRSRCLLWKR